MQTSGTRVLIRGRYKMSTSRASRRSLAEALEARQMLSVTNISNLQPAALDIPRINAVLQRSLASGPLSGTDVFGNPTINVVGFYDTGTSGVVLGTSNAASFGVQSETVNGTPVIATDQGVSGSDNFNVSEPLYVSLAPSESPNTDDLTTYQSVYTQTFGPLRTEIGSLPTDPITQQEANLFGMSVIGGKSFVMDMREINQAASQQNFQIGTDFVSSFVSDLNSRYDPVNNTTAPGIPPTALHIRLSSGSFDQFTKITPAGAPGPTFAENPFIGPNPIASPQANPVADTTPPVSMSLGGNSTTGSFIFDTGAQESFISQAKANKLGVFYRAGTYGTANADLVDASGTSLPNQFTAQIAGVGGTSTIAGFYLDSLSVQTAEGVTLNFQGAPVLVNDVTVKNPTTNQTLTLDGDFGMNFITATAQVNPADPVNPFTSQTPGAFDWAVFDSTHGFLGLQPAGVPIPSISNTVSAPAGAANVITLRRDPGGVYEDVWVNTPASGPATQLADLAQPITLNSGGKVDTLVLDTLNGDPLPANLVLNGKFTTGALAINANERITLGTYGSTLSMTALSIAPTGVLDLQNNSVTIQYGAAPSPNAAVASLVLRGRHNTDGIVSGTAAAGQAVGWLDQTAARTELIKTTYLGDANLDGTVNFNDFIALSNNFGAKTTNWSQGDFDGNGLVNFTDFISLSNNFGKTLPAVQVAGALRLSHAGSLSVAAKPPAHSTRTALNAKATTSARHLHHAPKHGGVSHALRGKLLRRSAEKILDFEIGL